MRQKRSRKRARRPPEGSGAPVGAEYHWFFAPTSQVARKIDANTYETRLEGLKWKLGFRPATSETWDDEWGRSKETARQRAIRILEQTLADLKADEREGAAPLEAPHLEGERPAPPKRTRKAKTRKATKTAKPKKAKPPRARASGKASARGGKAEA